MSKNGSFEDFRPFFKGMIPKTNRPIVLKHEDSLGEAMKDVERCFRIVGGRHDA